MPSPINTAGGTTSSAKANETRQPDPPNPQQQLQQQHQQQQNSTQPPFVRGNICTGAYGVPKQSGNEVQGSPSSSNKEQQQQQKRQLHHEVHATKDLPSTSSSSASSSSVSHVHDSPRLLRPERIRRANLHDDFQYSPLVRSPSLKPLAKSAETEFYRGVNLKGPSKEWTVLSTPTESNPTWSIGSGANIQHVTYSEMWKLFNHTATYYTDDDEANLKRLQPQDQSKMKIFSDFVSSHHNSLGLPPPHSSIVIRTAQGGKTEQFFVLRVGDPIGNSTRHEFKIVSTTGSVLTVQLDETEK